MFLCFFLGISLVMSIETQKASANSWFFMFCLLIYKSLQGLPKICENRRLLTSSCLSVLSFVLIEKIVSQMLDSYEILCLNILRNHLYRKLKVCQNLTRITCIYVGQWIFMAILLKSSSYEKCFRRRSTKNQNTILCSKTFFLKKCHL